MEETVTSVKLARAIRATQRRLRVRLRVAFLRASVGRERVAPARWAGRRRAKVRERPARRRREPPPRNAAVLSSFPSAPVAKRAMAVRKETMEMAREIFGGLVR